MDSKSAGIVAVEIAWQYPVSSVGGKSRNISICNKNSFRVPDGFAITTDSYFEYIQINKLAQTIDQELLRKNSEDMRWEEIWDSALRIRLSFMKAKMPDQLESEILEAVSKWPAGTKFSVRSSSPDEDSKEFSYAGVHESYINVPGGQQIIEKVKLVWASLWSDRALLYKKETGLDSSKSAMAVLVQKMEYRDISGLAFTMDPSNSNKENIIIEAIRGTLNLLVDNKKSPERFKINKKTGEQIAKDTPFSGKTLTPETLKILHGNILKLEEAFGVPIDIEWTGTGEEFTVLQVRPITVIKKDKDSEREWYLTLTPSGQKLIDLAEKVENVLIPALKIEGEALSKTSPEGLSADIFLEELKKRGDSYNKWTKIYRDDFIPFANGIRNFGSYYNDIVKPEDPYEFVILLKTQELMAKNRNLQMNRLADYLRLNQKLKEQLERFLSPNLPVDQLLAYLEKWEKSAGSEREMASAGSEREFATKFLEFLEKEMDVSYENISLKSAPEVTLRVIVALSDAGASEKGLLLNETANKEEHPNKDEDKLIEIYYREAKDQGDLESAERWLKIGKISWKLRDDDNLLVGKIENQLLGFMAEALKRLLQENKIEKIPVKYQFSQWETIYYGMVENRKIEFPENENQEMNEGKTQNKDQGKARQLVGQPSSPGVITGLARVIKSIDDFKEVVKGDVLVFDAVEPQMTFIISLAGAIVERRGGMLVHSSIIAREMRIPAVNGVPKATEWIKTGDWVTVNGDLGIVVIGKPEFEVELGATRP